MEPDRTGPDPEENNGVIDWSPPSVPEQAETPRNDAPDGGALGGEERNEQDSEPGCSKVGKVKKSVFDDSSEESMDTDEVALAETLSIDTQTPLKRRCTAERGTPPKRVELNRGHSRQREQPTWTDREMPADETLTLVEAAPADNGREVLKMTKGGNPHVVNILVRKTDEDACRILSSLTPKDFARTASEFKDVLELLPCPKCATSGHLRHAGFTSSGVYRKIQCKPSHRGGCKHTIGGVNLCAYLEQHRSETTNHILSHLTKIRSTTATAVHIPDAESDDDLWNPTEEEA